MRLPERINLPLKMAIIGSRRHQQDVAKKADVDPQLLSHMLYYRRKQNPAQQRRLVKVLGLLNHRTDLHVFEHELFPNDPPTIPPDVPTPPPEPVPMPIAATEIETPVAG